MKEFFELVAKDKAVQEELEKASLEALKTLLESKGLAGEAQKVLKDVVAKVARAHGFKNEMEELDLDEMKAVAGGYDCTGLAAHLVCDIFTW